MRGLPERDVKSLKKGERVLIENFGGEKRMFPFFVHRHAGFPVKRVAGNRAGYGQEKIIEKDMSPDGANFTGR